MIAHLPRTLEEEKQSARDQQERCQTIDRAQMLVKDVYRLPTNPSLDYKESIWWLWQAEQAYYGSHTVALHRAIRTRYSSDEISFSYIATGKAGRA